jgi:hypothetical protein
MSKPTISRNAGLDKLIFEGISGHSMRVGAAQDFLNLGASMPLMIFNFRPTLGNNNAFTLTKLRKVINFIKKITDTLCI